MMQKSGGFIALLLVVSLLLLPIKDIDTNTIAPVSPQAYCGDTYDTQDDISHEETIKALAVVVIIIVVLWILVCVYDEYNSQEVKADWKLF